MWARYVWRFVQDQEADVKPNGSDRRLKSQPDTYTLRYVGRLNIAHSLEQVAGVRKDRSADRSPQRKSQLVVYDQHRITTQRAGHQLRVPIRIPDDVVIRVALRHQDLRPGFFKAETSQVARASREEPFGDRKRVFTPKRRRQTQLSRERKHGVAETFDRIEAIVLDVELHELFVSPQSGRRHEKAPERLIPGGWIELVIALVSQEAWPDSTESDWL